MIIQVVSVVINYLDRGALSVAAPRISAELGLSPGQMGVVFSAAENRQLCASRTRAPVGRGVQLSHASGHRR